MKTLELEVMSTYELSAVKGGQWIYDAENDEWYWLDPQSLDDPFPTGGM